MATDEIDARIQRGIALLTAHLSRDPSAGMADGRVLRSILGKT